MQKLNSSIGLKYTGAKQSLNIIFHIIHSLTFLSIVANLYIMQKMKLLASKSTIYHILLFLLNRNCLLFFILSSYLQKFLLYLNFLRFFFFRFH